MKSIDLLKDLFVFCMISWVFFVLLKVFLIFAWKVLVYIRICWFFPRGGGELGIQGAGNQGMPGEARRSQQEPWEPRVHRPGIQPRAARALQNSSEHNMPSRNHWKCSSRASPNRKNQPDQPRAARALQNSSEHMLVPRSCQPCVATATTKTVCPFRCSTHRTMERWTTMSGVDHTHTKNTRMPRGPGTIPICNIGARTQEITGHWHMP